MTGDSLVMPTVTSFNELSECSHGICPGIKLGCEIVANSCMSFSFYKHSRVAVIKLTVSLIKYKVYILYPTSAPAEQAFWVCLLLITQDQPGTWKLFWVSDYIDYTAIHQKIFGNKPPLETFHNHLVNCLADLGKEW